MDEVIKKAHELSEQIKKEPIVIEYLHLKELIENDEELKSLRKKIALAASKKDAVNHQRLKEMYDNHPLVNNFYLIKEEVENLLLEIKNIIL